MLFNLALCRAFHGLMMPGPRGADGNPGAAPPPPPPARTLMTLEQGDPGARVEDRWEVGESSPLVTAWPFLGWVIANARASAVRSSVAGTILLATRRPTEEHAVLLEEMPILTTEVDVVSASAWAHDLDIAGVFDGVFQTFAIWKDSAAIMSARVLDPAKLRLRDDDFADADPFDPRTDPTSLSFLNRTSIGALLRADDALSAEQYRPLALSRAFLLLGSKDNQIERNDEGATVRIAAERITSVLSRMLDSRHPTHASLADRFPQALTELNLPFMFRPHAFSSMGTLREITLAHKYMTGSAPERNTIEQDLVLNVGQSLKALGPVLDRFSDPTLAFVQLERMTSQLLPPTLAASSCLVRFSELNTMFSRAAWSATISHALATNPSIDGSLLVTALIQSQAEIADPVAGDQVLTTGDDGQVVSFGSVREQVLGDALRAEVAVKALAKAASLTGEDFVDCLMFSGSVLLTRAMLMQEAWLHHKSPALGFASLAAPSLGPFFATNLTEDDDGVVAEKLQSLIFPDAALAVTRTPHWSKMGSKLMDLAIEIHYLNTGCRNLAPNELDRYTVHSCLLALKEVGSRWTFALGMSLTPQDGFSFEDGVDLQIKACNVARSLPKLECADWLLWLCGVFKNDFLDASGVHYHAKVRSARPDHVDAQISECLPSNAIFFAKVKQRIHSADRLGDMRIGFPRFFASESVAMAGTSISHAVVEDDDGRVVPLGKRAKAKAKKEAAEKVKGKAKGKQPRGGAADSGPGSKSGFAYSISPKETFLCGTVFKVEEICRHFKMSPPDKYCWPVLLSKKKGAAALELCPEHAAHGDMKQAVHTRPNSFDLDYTYKNFTRKPTTPENEHANWVPSKKGKN